MKENSIEEIAEVDEDRAIREIKRELADEDRKEYMSRWFAKDLEILVYYIEKLQKENEELKAKWDKDTHILQNELDLTNADKINNYIPVQKVKDKIKKNEEIIDISDDVDTIHELYQENTIYEKLLESEE